MPKVNAEGKANWDIMVPSDTTEVKTEETPVETKEESGSETAIAFNNIEVRNLMLNYQDICPDRRREHGLTRKFFRDQHHTKRVIGTQKHIFASR